MTTTPSEPLPDAVPEADWAEQQVGAEPDGDALLAGPQDTSRSVTTEADTADLTEQDTIAYVEDDEV
jgi:hypothetical protein